MIFSAERLSKTLILKKLQNFPSHEQLITNDNWHSQRKLFVDLFAILHLFENMLKCPRFNVDGFKTNFYLPCCCICR